MGIYQVIDSKKIQHLYDGWKETMIYSYFDGYMGKAYATKDNQSAMVIVADFCFLAGIPSKALLEYQEWGDYIILVPKSNEWNSIIEKLYSNIVKRERYATHKDIHCFDINELEKNLLLLSPSYYLKSIDESLYYQVLSQTWSHDLCGQFKTYAEFYKNGFGFAILENDDIIAGVSTYTVYKNGIEIEIDTRIDKRRQGLARICASKMMLECFNRNLYPSWDAHNQQSLQLAQSLGYLFDHSYVVYEVNNK